MADSKLSDETIKKCITENEEVQLLIKELQENAPPLEILAKDEVEEIERAGKILAAKAEAYYLGYLKGQRVPGGEVADAGVTIVAATAGSAVGTVVGQIVGKKMGNEINLREQLIHPEIFRYQVKETK